MKHVTPAIRYGCPAINVKDHTLWAQLGETREAYAELDESRIEALYEQARDRFWADVALLATEAEIDWHQDGRSGGWIVVSHTHFLELVDLNQVNPYDDAAATLTRWQEAYDASMGAESDGLFDTGQCKTAVETVQAFMYRDAFLAFAAQVDTAMDQAGDYFLELISEEVAELHAARENAIVRGEN